MGVEGWSKINYGLDNMAEKTVFTISIGSQTQTIVTHKSNDYENIYCQTNTRNARAMSRRLNELINQSKQYGKVSKIIIVKNEKLQEIACYDHVNDALYISEELIDDDFFSEKVDKTYFPSRTIEDILNHELGGHKKRWEVIYAYARRHNVCLDDAKQALGKYVENQNIYDDYTDRNVSINAGVVYRLRDSLNELIVDVNVLNRQGKVTDEYLFKLVMEVLNYDG